VFLKFFNGKVYQNFTVGETLKAHVATNGITDMMNGMIETTGQQGISFTIERIVMGQ
jgi:hypothetical protein